MTITIPSLTQNFCQSRRGAIAMTFAICLVPLILLIGLAIDYSFYVQASEQASKAAEAAATQAVRTAAAGYALDIDNKMSVAAATTDAVSEGELAGQQWFLAQSGRLVRGSAHLNGSGSSNGVLVTPSTGGTNGGAGFTASVSYNYSYPPFFNTLFSRTSNWVYNNSSTAQAVYQYVEVVLLLDTSGSMLIGADQSDVNTISENSVCFPSSQVSDSQGLVPLRYGTAQTGYLNIYPYDTYGSLMGPTVDNDLIDFTKLYNGGQQTYNNPSHTSTDVTGTCNSGFGISISGNPASQPGTPCALACHTTTTTVGGYFADPYGEARRLINPVTNNPVQLREDVVLTAAEQVATDLYSAEQTANQFTLGVYQFNDDVSTIVDGGTSAEATTDLTDALTTIKSYDYKYAGNNALLPTLKTNSNPQTNFPLAVTHLLSGTTYNGTTVPPLQPVITNNPSNLPGTTASNPEKNIFIVTDGLEDSNLATDFGEMTSYKAENLYTSSGTVPSNNASCAELKNSGFNVYVLYVTYYPLPFVSYYQNYLSELANSADAYDFGLAGPGVFPRLMTQPTSVAEVTGTNPDASVSSTSGLVSPTEEALEACATKGDFYIASSSSDITTAMTAMLKSAINSSIEVTR
jgi:Flp pilus assembly protein TadG